MFSQYMRKTASHFSLTLGQLLSQKVQQYRYWFVISVAVLLSACSSVKMSTVDSTEYFKLRRGDVISTGKMSHSTLASLNIIGKDVDQCESDLALCHEMAVKNSALSTEKQLSAFAELWLYKALSLDGGYTAEQGYHSKHAKLLTLNAYIESARYAYAYLFFTKRTLEERALEDRQNQVRDFYNYATQRALALTSEIANRRHKKAKQRFTEKKNLATWDMSFDTDGLTTNGTKVEDLQSFVPDTQLSFDGLRNIYTNDGVGARMVVTLTNPENKALAWMPMQYISVTALLCFPGKTIDEIFASRQVTVAMYDTHSDHRVFLNHHTIPLASNYSAAYGMWLANSNFSSQAIATLFGKGDVLEQPRLYLMQRYQPELKTIILIHGLASSPEAWVNAANEIMGDEELRKNYQIWQIYYPTSAAIAMNRKEIYDVIEKTLNHYDPQRKNPASQDIVLVGHSMGGVISRLLVSSSGDILKDALMHKYPKARENWDEWSKQYGSYAKFEPLPEVSRAIFIASPHRGTPFADKTLARFVASMVKLPVTILVKAGDATRLLLGQNLPEEKNTNGIDNLSSMDPAIRILAELPISQKVVYHSIIGNKTPKETLENSSDGIVPYTSSHLAGAASEVVIPSGHSVQETPEAIIEIRRILHEHLLQKKQ